MVKPKLIFFTICALIITSCDCHQNVSGNVLDYNSKEPIDSVFVQKAGKDYGKYTSITGEFDLSHIDGGIFNCPDMNIILTKDGYETKNISIPNSSSKIILLNKKVN